VSSRVLFVCTHNSARSQMAEGFLRHLGGDAVEAASAGTEPGELHPLAVDVMAEAGIDISGQRAKAVDDFVQQRFDYVITVCDDAREACPFFPGAARRLHWSLPDPSAASGSREERLSVFQAVRDEVRRRVEEFLTDGTQGAETRRLDGTRRIPFVENGGR
jgi:arsenate reductase (thioredoxin)